MTGLAEDCSLDSRRSESPSSAMSAGAAGADGSLCAWDGRLHVPKTTDAAEFALEVYRRRGAAGFHTLIGDWSLAIRDAGQRALVLASDYAGARPLYYRIDGGAARWSSSLADLAAEAPTPRREDRYFAALLSGRPTLTLTPYRGIEAVPAGCAVRIAADGVRVERFWDMPAPAGRVSAADCEERLLELFHDAVADRVRGHGRVCCELSGGLDSSSIACAALRLHPKVTLYSYTHPGAADAPYISAVEERYGVRSAKFDVREFPFVTRDGTGDAAPEWWEPRHRGLAAHMDSLGATALLTGQLGDLTMGNTLDDSEQVAAPLRWLRLGQAAREAYRWSQALRIPIYPILWRASRMAFSSWTPEADLSPTAWQRVERENSLGERLRGVREAPVAWPRLNWRAAPPDRRRRFRGLASWLESRRLAAPAALRNVAYSHPFSDRRLVEFLLSLPPGEIVGPGEPRRLMRRAFRELLPEPVLRRRSKASFGGFYDRCLAPLAQEMLREPGRLRTVELGYLERDSLVERLGSYLAGKDCNADQLRVAILVEYWLRSQRYL